MNYQDQNQQNQDEQGSSMQNQNQQAGQPERDWPTSAGGNKTYDHPNQSETDQTQNRNETPESGQRDDANSRMRDTEEEDMEPQIDREGEFENKSGWMREEGLSNEERSEAEEEDLGGRRSNDDSIL